MSAIFSQPSILCGTIDGNDLTKNSIENITDKLDSIKAAGTSYADKIKTVAKVQVAAKKRITSNLNKSIVLTPKDPEGPLIKKLRGHKEAYHEKA